MGSRWPDLVATPSHRRGCCQFDLHSFRRNTFTPGTTRVLGFLFLLFQLPPIGRSRTTCVVTRPLFLFFISFFPLSHSFLSYSKSGERQDLFTTKARVGAHESYKGEKRLGPSLPDAPQGDAFSKATAQNCLDAWLQKSWGPVRQRFPSLSNDKI